MSTEFQPFYQQVAAEYEDSRYRTRYGRLFRQLHYRTLHQVLETFARDADVLEVACGTGHTTRFMASMGFEHTACDLTPEMMAVARQSAEKVCFFRADAFHLPVPDSSQDLVISTRFLHLFGADQQALLFAEFQRVLRPGGILVVDFDNLYARWIYAIPHFLYNLVRYRRAAPFSIYNRPGKICRELRGVGFEPESVLGMGGWHLVFPALISEAVALSIGWAQRNWPWRLLTEQFLIVSRKE